MIVVSVTNSSISGPTLVSRFMTKLSFIAKVPVSFVDKDVSNLVLVNSWSTSVLTNYRNVALSENFFLYSNAALIIRF